MQQELARRAREGDHDAFSALVRETLGRLYTTARLILRDPDRAEDAVQDALIEAWRDIRGLRDLDRLDAWLHRLLVRSCYRAASGTGGGTSRRSRSARSTTVPRPDRSLALADRDEIERAFLRLTQDQRTVLILVYFADLSLADAAVALGHPDRDDEVAPPQRVDRPPRGPGRGRAHPRAEGRRRMSALDRTDAHRRPRAPPSRVDGRAGAGHGPDRRPTTRSSTRRAGAGQRPWFLVRRGDPAHDADQRAAVRRGARSRRPMRRRCCSSASRSPPVCVVGGRLLADTCRPASVAVHRLPTGAYDTIAIEDRATPGRNGVPRAACSSRRVTFQATPGTPGDWPTGDICPSVRDEHAIHRLSRIRRAASEDLRIIRPWAVDVSDRLAITRTRTRSRPRSSQSPPTSGFDRPRRSADEQRRPGGHVRRGVPRPCRRDAAATPRCFAGRDVTDRDHCLLRPDPGSGDPVIEIRRDMSALFVLIDLDGELIVIRASTSGLRPRQAGSKPQSRGDTPGADASELQHLLGLVHDIRFGD